MKKNFLILAFIVLISAMASGEGKTTTTTPSAISTNSFSNSFMTIFGMNVETAEDIDHETLDPSIEPNKNSSTIGMSIISASAVNQVTPPFTPHTPK